MSEAAAPSGPPAPAPAAAAPAAPALPQASNSSAPALPEGATRVEGGVVFSYHYIGEQLDKLKAAMTADPAAASAAASDVLMALNHVKSMPGVKAFHEAFDAADTAEQLAAVLDAAARDPQVGTLLSRDDMIARARRRRAALDEASASHGGEGPTAWTPAVAAAFGRLLAASRAAPLFAAAAAAELTLAKRASLPAGGAAGAGSVAAAAAGGAGAGADAAKPGADGAGGGGGVTGWDPMYVSNTIDISEGTRVATQVRGSGSVLAAPLPNKGVHTWVVRIEAGSGNCLTVGVGVRSMHESQHNVTGLHAGGSIIETFHGGRKKTGPSWMPGAAAYKLKSGTIVRVVCDMDERTLSMTVNDAATGVIVDQLPDDVCPAVSLRQSGHAVRLVPETELPPGSAT